MIEVGIYSEIRSLHQQGVSDRKIARDLHISRTTVIRYRDGAVIPSSLSSPPRERGKTVVTEDVDAFILNCFDEDKKENLKKQSHTAHRIYERLRDECGFTGSESTIRRRVRELKAYYYPPSADLPLYFDPGEAMQVDFGQSYIYLKNVRVKKHHFVARLCYSCAPYVFVGHGENTETFIEGIRKAFEFFGGVPRKVIFDNGSAAVRNGFGKKAVATDAYSLLAAHYGFETVFCNVASGNEKGLVENLVGYSRRNFMTPLPRVNSIQELNDEMDRRCRKYIGEHKVKTRNSSVCEQFEEEKIALLGLPAVPMDTAKVFPSLKVNEYSLVTVDTCKYSVPVRHIGKMVTARLSALEVRIIIDKNTTITHNRLPFKNTISYKLEHYIDEIRRKPRAAFQAEPVRMNIPDDIMKICRKLPNGDKDMVAVLVLFVEHGYDAVADAILKANSLDIVSVDVIRSFLDDTPVPGSLSPETRNDKELYPSFSVQEPDLKKYDKAIFGEK